MPSSECCVQRDTTVHVTHPTAWRPLHAIRRLKTYLCILPIIVMAKLRWQSSCWADLRQIRTEEYANHRIFGVEALSQIRKSSPKLSAAMPTSQKVRWVCDRTIC